MKFLPKIIRDTKADVRTAALALLVAAYPNSAHSLLIQTTYDASVLMRPDSADIKNAFSAATAVYSSLISNPVTVNVQVSWGTVGPSSMPSNSVAAAVVPLYGYFSPSQVQSWLAKSASSAADLSTISTLSNPATGTRFAIPKAEAKALGIVGGNATGVDGYIGFASSVNFDYLPANGISPGSFDFTSLALHELAEVLGRVSGLKSSVPTYATPFDFFRCSGSQKSFSYTLSANFSIDGCSTAVEAFNNQGSADRADWAGTNNPFDLQNAFISSGRQYSLSSADMIALDVLGWRLASNVQQQGFAVADASAPEFLETIGDPALILEPNSAFLLAIGTVLLALIRFGVPLPRQSHGT
jgi:hypothetical protein